MTDIQAEVSAAINGFVMCQKSKLGRNINPSELIRRVMDAGAYRVNVSEPIYADVGPDEVAVSGAVTAIYGGLADD
ncbi:hypothetical protein D3C78_1433110 [compost metagenome]